MFNLFKRQKASIDSISIPNFGWALKKNDSTIKQWINRDQTMALSLNFFASAPDIPTVKDINELRHFYRQQISDANGGIIQVDLINIDEIPCVKTIFKIVQGTKEITYLTSLTLPFKNCSYVIKIQAPELGTTGIRESVMGDRLLKEGVVKLSGAGLSGWTRDPYLEGFTAGTLMNLSESAEYDQDFPTHALSVSRGLMAEIESQMILKDILKKTRPFDR